MIYLHQSNTIHTTTVGKVDGLSILTNRRHNDLIIPATRFEGYYLLEIDIEDAPTLREAIRRIENANS